MPGTAQVTRLGPKYAWIAVRYTFKTSGKTAALCSGQIGIIPDDGSCWKIWHFSTILEQFIGFPSPDKFPEPDEAVCNGAINGTARKASDYACCVIGAGFAGLCLSARLKALGVDYITLDKNAVVGDNWRNRYRSATCESVKGFVRSK